jgi:uncharacterized protein (UPF0218 family)
MTLVIFDGNTKNYTVLNKNDNADKIELIKVQNDNKETTIKKKTYKKIKKLTKENEDFLNSLKTGSGFKIIPSSSIQQKD